jgi:hypothetical protein
MPIVTSSKVTSRQEKACAWSVSPGWLLPGSVKEGAIIGRAGRTLHHSLSIGLFFVAAATLAMSNVAAAQEPSNPPVLSMQKPALTAEQIVSRLQEKNHEREVALRRLHGTRIYRVHYDGFFGTREGEAVVSYNYVSPNHKEFVVQSQTGAKFILNHVIKGLLEGEKEASREENRQRTALSSRNYNFTLADAETALEQSQYVLNVLPKHDDKFLYRGKIWVDSVDFSVTRIEAEPAKSPSFWVKKSEVHHRYQKIGDFWLPAENRTESTMRMGGRALLSIEYKDYQLTETAPLEAKENAAGN